MTKVKRCPSDRRKMTLGENLNVHKGSIRNGYYVCKYMCVFFNYQNLFQRSLTFGSPKQLHSSQVQITIYLSEWLKQKVVTPPCAGRNVKKLDHSCIVHGNAKWQSQSGKQCGSFYKTQHLSQKNKNVFPHRTLHTNVQRSIIHNNIFPHKLEQPSCVSTGEQLNKSRDSHSMENYSAIKRNEH